MSPARKRSLVSRAGAAARAVAGRAAELVPGATSAPTQDGTPAPAKKAPAKKAPAKKAPAKKAPATKAPAKKAPAKKAPAKKAPAKKAAPATKAFAEKASATKASAKKTTRTTPTRATKKTSASTQDTTQKATRTPPVSTQKTTTKKTAAKKTADDQVASRLVVLDKEDPWTPAELDEVRTQLRADVERLTGELREVEGDLAGMIENPGDGSGHDQADIGSSSFERDQERQIVNNARDMLEQSQHALERIDDHTYGQCEVCGNAIGKNRLMAFPRATLCLTCKQREERR